MEEIKAYIESGILELYIIGELTQDERLEVENMAAKYPSIKDELTEIEVALEGYVNQQAIAPAEDLREKILKSVQYSGNDVEAKVITMPSKGGFTFYKYAFAASVVILLVSWAALFNVYNKLEDTKLEMLALQSSNQKYANQANFFDKQLADSKQALEVLANPDFKMVKLAGTKNSPLSSITVAFNSKKQDVMIDMTSMNMPENDHDHQYQLWAMVDGKPVDLGVFDMAADTTGMKRMKAIGNAQAFAVTLEKRGGNQSPTMELMMVMGSI